MQEYREVRRIAGLDGTYHNNYENRLQQACESTAAAHTIRLSGEDPAPWAR